MTGPRSTLLPTYPDPMPVFTIKAQDALAVPTILAYLRLCVSNGLMDQAVQVDLAAREVEGWQRRNPHAVQLPDHAHVPVERE